MVDEFAFDVVAGFKGLGKEITDPTLKRPSAELAGFLTYLTPSRLQVYGRTEMGLIEQLGPTVRMNHLEKVLVPEVPGLIVTRGLPVIEELRVLADEREIPLMTTNKSTTRLFFVLIRVTRRISIIFSPEIDPFLTIDSYNNLSGNLAVHMGKRPPR
ncbi:HPr Serine kinase N terminus [Acididesulfobacillus acetoxydans]|uniref:HPr Serine kinase N terminus n=1 Tax=Acididesulfobacillus acetoxydans TaxID=1561005 RepID=A0A8S0XDC8_9FIRM|nr:hypothetical protein [Acididesulfobacillus acetoxydans]CAA7603386.1 HPr Serine kinase N terminus [Acididesulfobacillus acetoxydans]CEJ08315.1 HPr kinase/phosphorylase [Acididesulfobacillus acetoxydans]